MGNSTYNFSFIAGGLLFSESLIVVDEHAQRDDWATVAERVDRENLLQARTRSASKRILREVCARLRSLTPSQLELLRSGSRLEQQQLLWLAVCKRYELLFDFASEVVRSQFLQLDLTVSPNAVDDFLEAKSIWHPEIEKLAETTRAKISQVAYRMLREAGILSDENMIQPTILSGEVAHAVQSDSPQYFTIFPVSEADIQAILA